MKTLLYFEENECNLSYELFKRNDLKFVILRTTKNMKYFSEEYLKLTESYDVFTIDYDSDIKKEANRFLKWCDSKKIKISYFLNDSEYYLDFVNRFAKLVGLESLNEMQIKWVRDKVDMKDRFNEIGLSTVKYMPIESKEDILSFFIKNGSKPIIFKPRRGMNSINVYKIESISDINSLPINIVKGKYMVEEFCYDQEWSIESLVQNGIVLDSYVTYIPNSTIWASILNNINCHMTVPSISSYFKFNPKEFIQKIVDGMDLKDGAMTIEVFIDKDGNIMPSELGWRLPGCQATMNHSISYGINMYSILIDIAIHNQVKLKYRDKIISVGDLYLPNKEGIITNVTPLEDLLKMDGVINGNLFVNIGKYNSKRRVGNDASGWVQIVGKDEIETFKKMQKVFESFIIETEREDCYANAKKI